MEAQQRPRPDQSEGERQRARGAYDGGGDVAACAGDGVACAACVAYAAAVAAAVVVATVTAAPVGPHLAGPDLHTRAPHHKSTIEQANRQHMDSKTLQHKNCPYTTAGVGHEPW